MSTHKKSFDLHKVKIGLLEVTALVLTLLTAISIVSHEAKNVKASVMELIPSAHGATFDEKLYGKPYQILSVKQRLFRQNLVTFTAAPAWDCPQGCARSYVYKDVPFNRALAIMRASADYQYSKKVK
jgi:hypothetical protein